MNVGKLGGHKTERKGTLTRKWGQGPQRWDILKMILRITTKPKPEGII